MKGSKTIRIITAALVMGAVASFAGALSGTLAWYAYSTRVTTTFEGTSVSSSEQLQIGLNISGTGWNEAKLSALGLELSEEDPDYAFAQPGVGLKPSTLSEFLTTTHYASNKLEPVTTRYFYDSGDDEFNYDENGLLNLWKSPMNQHPEFYSALKRQYVYLPFGFRVLYGDGSFAHNHEKVWVSDAKVDGEGNITNALRVHFNGPGVDRFIYNPSSESVSSGSTKVGGVLNLGGSPKYYDFKDGQEILYGDITSSTLSPTTEEVEFDDINGSTYDEVTTFSAGHKEGITRYSSITSKVAEYESKLSAKPDEIDGAGRISGGRHIAEVDPTTKIAKVNTTIYLEGWDFSVIDGQENYGFTLGLQFQIDRI